MKIGLEPHEFESLPIIIQLIIVIVYVIFFIWLIKSIIENR
jgi:hypothetical protein